MQEASWYPSSAVPWLLAGGVWKGRRALMCLAPLLCAGFAVNMCTSVFVGSFLLFVHQLLVLLSLPGPNFPQLPHPWCLSPW